MVGVHVGRVRFALRLNGGLAERYEYEV
jgi:hypothetical protein